MGISALEIGGEKKAYLPSGSLVNSPSFVVNEVTKPVVEKRVRAGAFEFVTKGENEHVEWHPTDSQLQLMAQMHQCILTGNLSDDIFATVALPIHESYRNADSCVNMNRTDILGPGNCLTPNVHILEVLKYLRTKHLTQFYSAQEAELHVMALRLATVHHDDGKTLGATNGKHPITSIQIFRAIVKKLIRTHHAFQEFPALVYSEKLAKLQKELIDTMRMEMETTKDGRLGKPVRTRHYQLLILLLRDEVKKALDLQRWLQKYPEFKDQTFAHLALILNEADLMASECLQFLITVNRIVLEQLLAETVATSAETHFVPPYR